MEEGTERYNIVDAEDGGRGHEPRGTRQFLEAGKTRKQTSPLGLQKGAQPCQHLDYSPVKPISDLNCKIINVLL